MSVTSHARPPESETVCSEASKSEASKLLHLAIVEDDALIRESLQTYLSLFFPERGRVKLHVFSGAPSFLHALEDSLDSNRDSGLTQLDCLICDAFLPSFEAARQVLHSARAKFPDVRLALLTGYATEQLLPLMMDQDITQAWIKNVPFDYAEFGLMVKQLLMPETSFGLANQLEGAPESFDAFETIHVTSSHQISSCLSRFREILSAQQADSADEMMTCFAEALTNAVYHAPRNAEGQEKYKKLSVIDHLLPSETVTVEMGADHQKVGFSVQDQFGALSPKTLLYLLHRHQTGNGLLDTHGRGLYLMHSLADRLVVSLAPGKKTGFTLLTCKQGFKMPVGDRPILIHLLPDVIANKV